MSPLWLLLACRGPYVLSETPQPDPDGLVLVWGDLHAHSGWSFDGCEEPDQRCTHRGALPAEDFLASAAQAGLDFVALTDHAEADTYTWAADPLHAEGGQAEVWPGQQAALQAQDGGVIPILGYEWTTLEAPDAVGPGTHRTVLLEDPAACAAYRVAGRKLPDEGWVPELGDRRFDQDAGRVVEVLPEALWQTLDQAALQPGCTASRWLSFAHHPAYANPQETDWEEPDNTPLDEGLVEIYSEHGSSECLDPDAPGCDWMLNLDQGYVATGSVQAALDRGYGLGFTGGTDSHDARPGSLADGPSHVAHWESDGTPEQHLGPGGLTGVLVEASADRAAVFDGLLARRTVATSGPRPELRVYATGQSGARYNPGARVPRDELPLTLELAVGALDPGGTLVQEDVGGLWIEQIGPGGEVLQEQEGDGLVVQWDPDEAEAWTYLRVRYARLDGEGPDGEGLDEERVWISPWFVQGGCASAPAAGGLLLVLPVLLRRRRLTARSG